ncbi:MAG: glycosyltransferase family 2 protein [Candidatus Saccharibacteria bacterium]|nr:glycosyltransferase family 2 protein [Candidatus Saccharibacteria bacterium]
MRITTILPVSRVSYLDRVLESLNNQTYKIEKLIIIFDGSDDDFNLLKDKVDVKVTIVRSTNKRPAFSIPERRQHIANIHNQLRDIVDSEYIFSVEDDGILPSDALERLVHLMKSSNAGMVSGVELGRWGVQYVGAWVVDDIYDTKMATSLLSKVGSDLIEEIDACGLYCALIRGDMYRQHEFDHKNGLGPDVNLGLFIRQEGFSNYIDWSVPVTHLTSRGGVEIEIPASDTAQVVQLSLMRGNIWAQSKYGQTRD